MGEQINKIIDEEIKKFQHNSCDYSCLEIRTYLNTQLRRRLNLGVNEISETNAKTKEDRE